MVTGKPSTIVEDGNRVGTGDYDGLRFAYHVDGTSAGYPWPITGTLDRGN